MEVSIFKLKADLFFIGAEGERGGFNGIIHSVVNIEGGYVAVADAGASYVRLVRKYQGGGNRVHGNARSLVVISYRGDYDGYLVGGHTHIIENTECHYRAALGMVYAVYEVSDVVQIGGYFGELHRAFAVTELRKYMGGAFRNTTDVCEAMLRIAESLE